MPQSPFVHSAGFCCSSLLVKPFFFRTLIFFRFFALCAKRAALCFFQSTFLAYGCSSDGYLCPACSAGGCAAGDPAASTRSELHSQLRSRLHSDSCAQRGANDGSPQR